MSSETNQFPLQCVRSKLRKLSSETVCSLRRSTPRTRQRLRHSQQSRYPYYSFLFGCPLKRYSLGGTGHRWEGNGVARGHLRCAQNVFDGSQEFLHGERLDQRGSKLQRRISVQRFWRKRC